MPTGIYPRTRKHLKNLSWNYLKGKTREDIYGKEKAREWSNNVSKALTGVKRKSLSETHKQNIGKALKGKMPKNLKEINKNKKGEGNPMFGRTGKLNSAYIHGLSKEPYPEEWTLYLRNSIRKRDNQICMNCGIHREKLNKALCVHHIDYDKKNCLLENLISLCEKCHLLTNINREYWEKLFQEKLSKLYNYQYINGKIVIKI